MNEIIRKRANEKNVRLWQIADKLGMAEATFSRKLRKEFPVDENKKVLIIIDEISKENNKTKKGE